MSEQNSTNGTCLSRCQSFPDCKPCGEIEAAKKRQWAIANRILSRIKKAK